MHEHSSKKNANLTTLVRRGIFVVLLIVGIFVFVNLSTKYWNGKDKLAFAFRDQNGDVGVTVADPVLGDLTTLIIPGDTEVNVAENYGTLRIKNVWQLSQNEKLKGKLLPETVMQNFLFPLNLWSGESGEALGEGRLGAVLEFVFNPGTTNIPLGDRLGLATFSLKVQSLGKSRIDLGQSQFLRKEKLNDGLAGFRLNGDPSERLTVYFSDNTMSQVPPKVYIIDETGDFGVAEMVGKIIEVMGGKVVSIDKRSPMENDCQITGAEVPTVKKIANIFSCKIVSGKTDFDIELRLGESFARRF